MKNWKSRITKFKGVEIGSRNTEQVIHFRPGSNRQKRVFDSLEKSGLQQEGEIYKAGAYYTVNYIGSCGELTHTLIIYNKINPLQNNKS